MKHLKLNEDTLLNYNAWGKQVYVRIDNDEKGGYIETEIGDQKNKIYLTNEEFNWKKGLAGILLIGSLFGSSCSSDEYWDAKNLSPELTPMLSYNVNKSKPFNEKRKMMEGQIVFSENYLCHIRAKHHVPYTKIMVKVGNDIYFIMVKGQHSDEILKGHKVKFFLTDTGGTLYKGKSLYDIYPFAIDMKKTSSETLKDNISTGTVFQNCFSDVNPLTNNHMSGFLDYFETPANIFKKSNNDDW